MSSLSKDAQRFITGDIITVYGEGGGEITVFDDNYDIHTEPSINMAYVVINEE